MIATTVLRTGGLYSWGWVMRLRDQLARYLPGVEFRVLTDAEIQLCHGPPAYPLLHAWPGWWSKIELHRPGAFPDGELVFFLDLDTLVVDDVSFLADYDGDFASLRDFWSPEIAASGALLFRAGATSEIYERAAALPFMPPPRTGRSDPWWNAIRMPDDYLQDVFPGRFASYKAHKLDDGPGDASIVCFHGRPRLTEFEPPHWVAEAWG